MSSTPPSALSRLKRKVLSAVGSPPAKPETQAETNAADIKRPTLIAPAKTAEPQSTPEADPTQTLPPGDLAPGTATTAVLGNSLPKSGTHMLNMTVEHLGVWANAGLHVNINGYRINDPSSHGLHACPAAKVVPRLQPGYAFTAHLAYDPNVDAFMQSDAGNHVRHVFMVRDPRDLIVSWMRYATYSKTFASHGPFKPIHEHLRDNFENDGDRLEYAIEERSKFPYRHYTGWMDSPVTRVVQFEALHDGLEGAGQGELRPGLGGLLEFLRVDPEAMDLQALHGKVYGQSITSMRDKFKPSSFRDSFEERHYKLIDNDHWRHAVTSFGYDW
ncbi:MAG: hypothetical protein AAF328_02970 [Planctomycetota bacterium]